MKNNVLYSSTLVCDMYFSPFSVYTLFHRPYYSTRLYLIIGARHSRVT